MDRDTASIEFSETAKSEIEKILSRYPTKGAALLPVLHLAQEEFGVLTEGVRARVAQVLDLPPAHVEGVVSFYTLFKTKPTGRHVIWLCQTLSCDLAGTRSLLAHLERRWSLKPGGTTADGRFTLVMAECLGGCGTGPAMMVNWDYHDRLTPERVDEVLEKYR